MKQVSPNLKATFEGSFLIIVSSLMFGSYGLFSRFLGGYDVFFQTWVRCLMVTVIMVVFGLITKQFRKIDREDMPWFFLVTAFSLCTIAPIVFAFRFLELGTASFLFYGAMTVFTYILGTFFFKEKLTRAKVASFCLATVGMLAIFSFHFSSALFLPAGLAVLNGLASGGEITFTKKISSKYSTTQISAILFGAIAVTHLLISLILHENQNFAIVTDSGIILFGFVLVAIAGMATVVRGFRLVEPSVGAIIGLMEIVFSAAFGVIFFKEVLTLNIIIGGACIILAASLPDLAALLSGRSSRR